MFCWCLNLRNGTNNEYSQLLFIYQITPDSFTIDKSEYDVMHMEHREKGQASNIPSRHRRGTGDIILDYTGFGFFSLFVICFRLQPLETIERKFINVPEGWREIGKSN